MKDLNASSDNALFEWPNVTLPGPGVFSTKKVDTSLYASFGKRQLDLLIVIATLPFTLTVILICALVVVLDGKTPFFPHNRIGREGRVFQCWKLRSMVADAESRLENFLASNPAARAEWEMSHKLVNDPRITRFGAFLRKSSIDELPQIWNVLKGEMSIVGPRPVTETEMSRYGAWKSAYLALRPGITGLWQVSGRNQTSYDRRVAMDVDYRSTYSLWRDVAIILRTFRVVLIRNGH